MDTLLQSRLHDALAPAYEVESEIGRGGMAIVYRARDMRLKRGVAVKLLPPDLSFRDDIRTRFLREAEMSARLSHPNIVPIYSVDERDGLVYFVMGLVEGESVGDRLRRSGALPVAEARRILREVAGALAYAHARGVVHRDIKPDNVLLDGTSGRAMVTDFGIARAATDDGGESRLTATGVAIGTPAYMSPEQCSGDRDIDGRSDLYALGTVAYQMLTGEPPFMGSNTPAIMMKQVTAVPVPVRQHRAEIPEDLERIIMRLLEKEPANRFPDGAALVAALDGAPVTPVERAGRPAPAAAGDGQPPLASLLDTAVRRDDSGLMRPPEVEWSVSTAATRPLSRSESRELRRRGRGEPRPLAERVRRFRGRLVGYAGTSAFLFGINYLTGGGYWWCLWPMLGMGLSIVSGAGRLMGDGASLSDIIAGTVPSPQVGPGEAGPSAPGAARPLAAGISEDIFNGPFGAIARQAMADHDTVIDLVGRLTETERKLLPEVRATADALFARVVALAATLQRLDGQAGGERVSALDARIAQIEQEPGETGDRERRLSLLRRRRDVLTELGRSRAALLEQYESAGMLLQNLSLDLLKVRASGLDSAIGGLTSATQEARALSREIGYVLDAADEVRAIGDV